MAEESKKVTLAQAIKENTVPQYNRKLNKGVIRLLKAISTNLPSTQPVSILKKVTGAELIEDNVDSINGEPIDFNKEYTVFESAETKVNHLKRLKDAWNISSSPLNVIIYGFKFIGEDDRNEWISIVNDAFKTDYPPAYLDDGEEEENESA